MADARRPRAGVACQQRAVRLTIVARLSIVNARPTQEGGVLEAEVDSFDVIPREHTRNSMTTVAVKGA